MIQDYELLNMIGEGSFGRVYKSRRRYTGRLAAIKLINKLGQNAEDIETLRREIDILTKVNHPNIMKMIDVFETDTNFCIVTELARGDLFQIIDDNQALPEEKLKTIAAQLVSAIYHLHKNHIIHRDLKPQNILISSNGSVKVCDFGFARALSQTTLMLTSIKGTPLYMAPELVQEHPYNESIDIWSLGIILYELYHGSPPFYTESIYKLIQMIINNPIKYPETMSDDFRSFLEIMLEKDPSVRASAIELMNHPFIKDVDLSSFNNDLYNYKSFQFEEAITKSLNSHSSFRPPKSNKPNYQVIFLDPASYSFDDIKKALKYLIESKQDANSPLIASFSANISNFLQLIQKFPSISLDIISTATYVLSLDRERYSPQLLPITEIFGQPNMPIEIIPFATELLVIPFASSKVDLFEFDSSFLKVDEEKVIRFRDTLLSFIFTSDTEIVTQTYVFISFLMQVSPLFFASVCGDFIPQFAPLIVSALIRSESIVIKSASLSILSQLLKFDPTAVFFLQPIDQFLDSIESLIEDDADSIESMCCFSTILSFFASGFDELVNLPKFVNKFHVSDNVYELYDKCFDWPGNKYSSRLSLLLLFAGQRPSKLSEFLSYATMIRSPFRYIVVNESCLDKCVNDIPSLVFFHQPPLLLNMLDFNQEIVKPKLPILSPLFESTAASQYLSEYVLNILTPELAEEMLENDALIYLSHVIYDLGPNVPAETVLVMTKIILTFTDSGMLLLEQSRDVLNSIFSVDMAAESGMIIASHFARISADFLPALTECGALNLAARALLADIPRIRGRALDFVGNYCKYGTIPEDFLDMISTSVMKQLNCDDVDCQKMATYALSNILLHSPEMADKLFDYVTPEKLNDLLLNSSDSKLASNTASLCANLVRKSNKYVHRLIESQILSSIFLHVKSGTMSSQRETIATLDNDGISRSDSGLGDVSLGARALLQLSVFCQYDEARQYLINNNAAEIIKHYVNNSNERIQRYAKKLIQILV